MTTPKKRADRMAADQAMIDGTNQFFAKNAKVTVGNKQMLPADIVAVFQGRIDATKAVITAEGAATAAVAADRNELANTAPFVRAFKRLVQGTFQGAADTLAVFHLTDPKVTKTTVATKAQAKVKAEATRKARGTMGKKAKAKITGATPTTETTVAEGAPAVPAPAPAPQAPAPKPTA
jgi:hypothetical protein